MLNHIRVRHFREGARMTLNNYLCKLAVREAGVIHERTPTPYTHTHIYLHSSSSADVLAVVNTELGIDCPHHRVLEFHGMFGCALFS